VGKLVDAGSKVAGKVWEGLEGFQQGRAPPDHPPGDEGNPTGTRASPAPLVTEDSYADLGVPGAGELVRDLVESFSHGGVRQRQAFAAAACSVLLAAPGLAPAALVTNAAAGGGAGTAAAAAADVIDSRDQAAAAAAAAAAKQPGPEAAQASLIAALTALASDADPGVRCWLARELARAAEHALPARGSPARTALGRCAIALRGDGCASVASMAAAAAVLGGGAGSAA